MNIELKRITVRELTAGYANDPMTGKVVGYNGLLDIRPPYQREFVYNDKQRDAVIDTVMQGYPLNVMYWATRDDGTYEIIDGQQRTISLCMYVNGDFSYNFRYLANLQDDERERFLNYELMIYVCTGTPSEKLKWFETINIAGVKLTAQELRNAVFAGTWLSDAKRYFSSRGTSCPAYGLASDYMSGVANRQEYLETALDWISDGNIEIYMSAHQHDANATQLWLYFQSVISWVQATFTVRRPKIMKGVSWGKLYNKFHQEIYNTDELEAKIKQLILDDDVTNKKGIYEYLLTGNEKALSIRAFSDNMKLAAYVRQNGICPICKESFKIEYMEADHIDPWHAGGKTIAENCQMLCRSCNRRKAGV